MNFSYGHNLVTSIHQITESKKNKVDLQVKEVYWTKHKKMRTTLVRSLNWLPWLRTDHLYLFDRKKRNGLILDRFNDFVDFTGQFSQIKEYLQGTSILEYFQSYKDYQVVLIDNPSNFKEFYEKNTTRLLSMLCNFPGKILFSATISHRGFVGVSTKSLMLNDVRLFGKKVVLAEHVWVYFNKKWSLAEPIIGGKKVYLLGKVVPYTRKCGTIDYTIKATKVIRA